VLLALLGLVAAGGTVVLTRIPGAFGAMGKVLVLFAFGAVAAGVFLVGRHHARQRRERRKEQPPAP
jgi:hypothetical protein